MQTVTLLGPQRISPNVELALERAGIHGPVVSVTAGWRDAEGEIAELAEAVHRPVTDLRLYARAEAVFRDDAELATAHRDRQTHLRELQDLYRIRLRHATDAVLELDTHAGDSRILNDQRRAALAQLRLVDRQQRRQIRAIHGAFEARVAPEERPGIVAQRRELLALLAGAGAVLIAGGHVAALLNRLRLFGLAEPLRRMPIVAWSAGAMCVAPQIVLFHDNAPEGRRDPEIMDTGLGLVPGVVPLPHAARRLRLDDEAALRMFARRFAPAACLTLDRGSLLRWRDGRMEDAQASSRITRRGTLRPARPR